MTQLSRLLLLSSLSASTLSFAHQPPQIWIPPEKNQQPMSLETMAVSVTMQGFLARTRIEFEFYNPNPQVLEGEFVFPLAENQTLSGYALEVNGKLRNGVVVPKETARVAFEQTTRQQIDPGLVELTRGNVFRTRLYPIPARGSKRVAVDIEQVMIDAGTHWRYVLPLQLRQPIKHFSVSAEAPLDTPAPEVASDSPNADLHFAQTQSVWRAAFTKENIQPQNELSFRVPKQANDLTVLEAPNYLEPRQRAIVAHLTTGRPTDLPKPTPPKHITVLVDASGSAHDRDLARELSVLTGWLKTLDHVTVDLIPFRDSLDKKQTYTLNNGDTDALLSALRSLPLDGASNYSQLRDVNLDHSDAVVILGDGLDNFGQGDIALPATQARVFVLHAAQRADHHRLDQLAKQRGGLVINLTEVDIDHALAAFQQQQWQLLRLTSEGTCQDISLNAPQVVSSHVVISATCEGRARISLTFGIPGTEHTVHRDIQIGERDAVLSPLDATVWRHWAAEKIASLESQPNLNSTAIKALAMRHGVVSSQTSLLVLDRIEDYVRYGIEPPEPELLAQYHSLRAQHPKTDQASDTDRHLNRVAERWNNYRQWHNQRHPWLETLLVPAVELEERHWSQLKNTEDSAQKATVTAANKDVGRLLEQAKDLQSRWLKAAENTTTRSAWEREATTLSLALDDLRQRRLAAFPESGQWNNDSPHHPTLSPPSPPSMPSPSAETTLDRVEIAASVSYSSQAQDATVAATRKKVSSDAGSGRDFTSHIQLSGWNPDTPYLKALRESKTPYQTYLSLRKDNKESPSFFLDAADFFQQEVKNPILALRILSNLAEIGDENTALLRVLGYRLLQWDAPALSVRPLQDAKQQRPEEPQSYRDLALVLSRLPSPEVKQAAALWWHIVSNTWDSRFPDIEIIALQELTALIAAHPHVDISDLKIPPEFIAPVPVDLRVTMTWDADNTDIDLWVIDPTGQAVYYADPQSKSGGQVSRDFTQGYGPEVFTIARPIPGTYRVQAHYYGDRRQSLTGPVTVQLEFETKFGSPEVRRHATTRRLETGKQRIDIGSFRVTPN